jgi:hypothetical protein
MTSYRLTASYTHPTPTFVSIGIETLLPIFDDDYRSISAQFTAEQAEEFAEKILAHAALARAARRLQELGEFVHVEMNL